MGVDIEYSAGARRSPKNGHKGSVLDGTRWPILDEDQYESPEILSLPFQPNPFFIPSRAGQRSRGRTCDPA